MDRVAKISKCACARCLPTQGPGSDGPCYCDNCGGSVEPWPGIPGFDYGDRECVICGGEIPAHRRSDAVCCSAACRAEKSRLGKLGKGEAVDGYRDLKSYQGRQRRRAHAA